MMTYINKIVLGTSFLFSPVGLQASEDQPNILLFFVDDLGYHDVGYQGGEWETPAIDGLAERGMVFMRAYVASPTCSPSRGALVSGQHPARLNITRHLPLSSRSNYEPDGTPLKAYNFHQGDPSQTASRNWLPLEVTTIAEALKPLDYDSVFIGKWHLGSGEYYPDKQGYDEVYGVSPWGHPGSYYPPYWKTQSPYSGEEGNRYLTDRTGDDAVAYLNNRSHGSGSRPFYMHLSFYGVHSPVIGRKDRVEKHLQSGLGERIANYAAMVETVDENIGRVLDALEATGEADNTLVVFLSDQGSLHGNKPLRGSKIGPEALYEGSGRVPMVARWPGMIKPGSRCDGLVLSTDIWSTLVEVGGGEPFGPAALDGISLVSAFAGDSISRSRVILARNYEEQFAAVIGETWKMIAHVNGKRELYHLGNDPYETDDVSMRHPEKVSELNRALHDWQESLSYFPKPAERTE